MHENDPEAPYTVKSTRSEARAPASVVGGRTPGITDVTRTSSDFGTAAGGCGGGDVDPHPVTANPPTNTPTKTAILVLIALS